MLQESTISLIRRIREGDANAQDQLLRRFLPVLRRWARGRLPKRVRDLQETEDIVQVALLNSLRRIDHFASEMPGAFLLYLRTSLLNEIRDEIRRHKRRPEFSEIDSSLDHLDAGAPVAEIAGGDSFAAYQRAMTALPKRQQELLLMRVEFGMSYAEIAAEVGGTPDAARMMIGRSIASLAQVLKESASDE
jgi:RNA polymerase sigma factor (sigma-70 family)